MRSIFSKNVSKCLGLLCAAACIGFVSDGWGTATKRKDAKTNSTVSVKATITAIVGIKWGETSKTIKLVGEDGKQAPESDRTAVFEVESYTKGKLQITDTNGDGNGDTFYAIGPAGSRLEYKVSVNTPGTDAFTQWKHENGSRVLTWQAGQSLKIRGELVNAAELDNALIGDYEANLKVEITPAA